MEMEYLCKYMNVCPLTLTHWGFLQGNVRNPSKYHTILTALFVYSRLEKREMGHPAPCTEIESGFHRHESPKILHPEGFEGFGMGRVNVLLK